MIDPEKYGSTIFHTSSYVHLYLSVTVADRESSDWIKIKFQY